jgi:hypothetical protein
LNGSLRWAVNQATGAEIIRFAPALAGRMIVFDATITVPKRVTIEGDPTRGVTLSGAGRQVVMSATEGMTLRNLNVTDGYGFEGANSTVASNTPGRGISAGGPTTTPPMVTFRNSIVSGNGNGTTHGNCGGAFGVTFQGLNILTDGSCGTGAGMVVANPLLDIIANNGGPSVTMKLDRFSPAIKAGSSCSVTVDQRYVARDAKCDVGAYEFTDFNTVTLTIDPNVTLYKNQRYVVVKGTAKCTFADANSTGFSVRLQQRTKQVTTYASFLCTTTAQPWSVALETGAAGISSGSAVATAATVDTPTWYIPASTSRTVKLSAK